MLVPDLGKKKENIMDIVAFHPLSQVWMDPKKLNGFESENLGT